MIDFETAHRLVSAGLAERERRMNEFGSALPENKNKPYLHLAISEITEHDFGWVFCYSSSEYLETEEINFALAGNSPLIVDRHDGRLYTTGTAHPLEYYLDEYRKGIRTPA